MLLVMMALTCVTYVNQQTINHICSLLSYSACNLHKACAAVKQGFLVSLVTLLLAGPKSQLCTAVSATAARFFVTIGALTSQQACSRCCCFIASSWRRAFHQPVSPQCWRPGSLNHHFQTSRMPPTSQPRRISSAPQATTAGMRGCVTALWGSSGSVDVPFPTDKLPGSIDCNSNQQPVVLVNCGSFNPPTIMHLRMFDVAAQVLRKVRTQA